MCHRSDGFTAVFEASQVFQVSKPSRIASLRFPLGISQHLYLIFGDHHLLKAMFFNLGIQQVLLQMHQPNKLPKTVSRHQPDPPRA